MAKKKSYIGSITFIKSFQEKDQVDTLSLLTKDYQKEKNQEDKDEIFSSYSNIVS
jgi:hypothetical protein